MNASDIPRFVVGVSPRAHVCVCVPCVIRIPRACASSRASRVTVVAALGAMSRASGTPITLTDRATEERGRHRSMASIA